MYLSQKETMLLQDLQSQEQLCVEKYQRSAEKACDEQLRQLFTNISKAEQTHLNTINQMLSGTVPALSSSQNQGSPTFSPSSCSQIAKSQDCYLCQDALDTEKHVSSVYDTCIFEFKDANARNVLNHIQKEEQNHGKSLYDYMSVNGQYS